MEKDISVQARAPLVARSCFVLALCLPTALPLSSSTAGCRLTAPRPSHQVGAVIVGFDRHINYHKIQMATLCIRENPGCLFIATNLDAVTHLTDAQEWAGNGSMVGAIKGEARPSPLPSFSRSPSSPPASAPLATPCASSPSLPHHSHAFRELRCLHCQRNHSDTPGHDDVVCGRLHIPSRDVSARWLRFLLPATECPRCCPHLKLTQKSLDLALIFTPEWAVGWARVMLLPAP